MSGGNKNVPSFPKNSISAFGEPIITNLVAAFHVHFPYNINAKQMGDESTGSGSLTHADTMMLVHSGAATSSVGMAQSVSVVEYHPGTGVTARFTALFGTPTAGNMQYIGPANTTDGFMFGYEGTEFGVQRLQGGTSYITVQADWNQDPMDGTGPSGVVLDTSKGNVFQIRYQWLGYGTIAYYIENPATGILEVVHREAYANLNTVPSTDNPTFPMCVMSENTTNDTDIIIKTASMGVYTEGDPEVVGHPRAAVENSKAGITTETNILTIKNKPTYQSVTNQVRINADLLTMVSDGTKNVTVKVYLDTTLGGTPSYTDISTNTSVVSYDTAGTTITGGTLLGVFHLAKNAQSVVDLSNFHFVMHPGQILTFAAESSASTEVDIAIAWQERFS